MRVLLVGPSYSIHLAKWANGLASDHEVHVATLHAPDGQPYDDRVRVHLVGGPQTANYYLAAPRLRRLIRTLRPDIVHAHYATGYGTLLRFGAAGLALPKVLSVWGADVYDSPALGRWWTRLVRNNLRAVDVVTSTGHAMARVTEALTPVKRLEVIPFGIDTARFSPIPREPHAILKIGTVKTLQHDYGIDILIRAFSLAKQQTSAPMELVLYGGGPDLTALQGLAHELGIAGDVTFVGQIPHGEVPGALNDLDVYLALSRTESFGVAILEASSCGVPVIVSDADGPAEVTIDGVTGVIVPREDADAAAEAIVWLANDPTLRATMGAAGRQHVLDTYAWDISMARLNELYAELVSPRR